MPTYDFCGSVRVIAASEEEAYNIMDSIMQIESYHVNEIEVQN